MAELYALTADDLKILKSVVNREKGRSQNTNTMQPAVITTAKNRRLGKTDASIDKDSTGTVSLYAGTDKGSETDTTNDIEAYNRFGDIEADKWVFVEFIHGGWEIYQGECGE